MGGVRESESEREWEVCGRELQRERVTSMTCATTSGLRAYSAARSNIYTISYVYIYVFYLFECGRTHTEKGLNRKTDKKNMDTQLLDR